MQTPFEWSQVTVKHLIPVITRNILVITRKFLVITRNILIITRKFLIIMFRWKK